MAGSGVRYFVCPHCQQAIELSHGNSPDDDFSEYDEHRQNCKAKVRTLRTTQVPQQTMPRRVKTASSKS